MRRSRDRVLLFRPLSRGVLHSEVPWKTGSDARTLNAPGDISFTLAPQWADMVAEDGHQLIAPRATLVVVERPNRTIRNAGLVDSPPVLSADALTVSCGGLSMLAGQSGPWEGRQGYNMELDPVVLFQRIWDQVQSYENADMGIRVTGDTSSGGTVGDTGSRRWQEAEQQYNQLKPELDRWERRLVERERIIAQRQEQMFRAAGLKRIGNLTLSENEPDDPGYQADSALWVRDDLDPWRAYRFRNGRWVSQSQADDAVLHWRRYRGDVQIAKDEVDRLRYLIEPLQETLDEYESEEREEFGLYFWQNHNLNSVIEDLLELGPFEYREEAAWTQDEELDLSIRVGAPRVGVRRNDLRFELGRNVLDQPEVSAPGETYTGVALFGAGEGSGVLSAQRDWNPDHMVRRILTETDKDAHSKALTRAAADRLAKEARQDAKTGFTDLVIHHDKAVPEGSFDVGDQIYVAGKYTNGQDANQWVRVIDASNEWGSNKTRVEVEPV